MGRGTNESCYYEQTATADKIQEVLMNAFVLNVVIKIVKFSSFLSDVLLQPVRTYSSVH